MIRTKLVELSDTPTQLDWIDEVDRPVSIVIQNLADEGYVYLGTSSVSTSSFGIRIPPEGTFDVDLSEDHLYAATNGESITVAVMSLDI
jgi:hypothetical protein